MERTRRIVCQAQRRLTAGALLDASGRSLTIGALAALLAVGVSKLIPLPIAWPWLLGGSLAIAGVLGLVSGLTRRASSLVAAARVDWALQLHDRLGSATAFEGASTGPFVQLALDEAESASATADVRSAVPIAIPRTWYAWPTLALGALALALFAPSTDLFARRTQPVEANREQVQRSIDVAAKSIDQPTPPAPDAPTPPPSSDAAKVLDEIKRELAAGKSDPQAAAQRAVRELDRIATERDKLAERTQQQHNEVTDALRTAGASDPSQPDSDLAKALKSGDLAAASQAAQELLNTPKSADTPESRAKTAEELDQIASDLRAAAQAKRDAESASHTEPTPPPEKPAPTEAAPSSDKQRESPTPPTATDDLAKTIERAADALRKREPNPPPDKQSPAQKQAPSGQDTKPSKEQESKPAQPPQEQPRSDRPEQPKQDPKPQPGAAPPQPQAQPETPKQAKTESERRQPSPSNEPKQPSPEQQPKPDDSAKPSECKNGDKPGDGQKPSPDGTTARDSSGQGEREQAHSTQTAPSSTPKPASETGTTPSEQQPSQGAEHPSDSKPGTLPSKIPEPTPDGVRALANHIRKYASAPQDAANHRRQAEQMRKQAEEILKSASPEQRQQLERWHQQLARELSKDAPTDRPLGAGMQRQDHTPQSGNNPEGAAGANPSRPDAPTTSRTDTVDARRPTPRPTQPERTIAEWYTDRPIDPAATGAPALPPAAESAVHQAARAGERAVESQQVPARFDKLLLRYFQRLPDRAKGAPEPASTPSSQPAQDAR